MTCKRRLEAGNTCADPPEDVLGRISQPILRLVVMDKACLCNAGANNAKELCDVLPK